MWSLEDKLMPSADRHSWLRDALGVVPLALLLVVLFPSWSQPDSTYVTDVAGQVASPRLLAALGMTLALRMGAIDLSVWAITAGGSLTAAAAIVAGVSPMWAFALAAAVGAGCGAVNAALVVTARLPSPVATLLVAGGVIGLTWALVPGGGIALPDDAFDRWLLTPPTSGEDGQAPEQIGLPLIVTRTMLVAAIYSVVMAVLLWRRRQGGHVRFRRTAALVACGALAALAGAGWLLDHGRAVAPARLVSDFRIPAAALLAGAVFVAGPGRTLGVCACLPLAVLTAMIWRQQVWVQLGKWGYEWQVVVLMALVVLAQASAARVARWPAPARRWAQAGYVLGLFAIALPALAAVAGVQALLQPAYWASILAAGAAAVLLIVARRYRSAAP
ncbi:MAG TPA: hypothetical protein ENH78_16540 [Phycisphaerae bacterium]|nr:hypothetical protein [Phycisphaerae bacterium]